MSLIYAQEAWKQFGPKSVVHDARGRRIERIVSCNPVTGEVIDQFTGQGFLGALAQWSFRRVSGPLDNALWRRWKVSNLPNTVKRHYFAPAPLTISRQEPGAP